MECNKLKLFGVILLALFSICIVSGKGEAVGYFNDTMEYSEFLPIVDTDKLVGWWRLDNSTIDESDLGNDGTQTGTECFTTTDGQVNTSCYFDGNSKIATSNLILQNLTVMAWVNTTGTVEVAGEAIVSKYRTDIAQRSWSLSYGDAAAKGKLVVHFGNLAGAFYSIVTSDNPVLNGTDAWHHVGFVYESGATGTLTMYFDGEVIPSSGVAPPILNSEAALITIGAFHNGIFDFNGYIDDVMIINQTLDVTQINMTYLCGIQHPDCNSTAPSINSTKLNLASRIETYTGTHDGGNHTDTWLIDDKYYNVSEAVGTPGFNISMNFTNITKFNNITMRRWYEGNPAHNIEMQLYNVTSGDFVTVGTIEEGSTFTTNYTTIANYTDYNNSGTVTLNIVHTSAGNINHDIFIDYVALNYTIPGVPVFKFNLLRRGMEFIRLIFT